MIEMANRHDTCCTLECHLNVAVGEGQCQAKQTLSCTRAGLAIQVERWIPLASQSAVELTSAVVNRVARLIRIDSDVPR